MARDVKVKSLEKGLKRKNAFMAHSKNLKCGETILERKCQEEHRHDSSIILWEIEYF